MAKAVSVAMNSPEHSGEKSVRIRRGKVDSLSLYEITDHELERLEQGSPSGLLFNCAVALLSVSSSFLVALLTTEIPSFRTFTIFVVITTIGLIGGAVLLLVWYKTRQTLTEMINRIKQRIPPDDVEAVAPEDDT